MLFFRLIPVSFPLLVENETIQGKLAENVELSDGTTLEAALTAAGNYETQLLDNGDIIVAGYTAQDTATAAQKLIDALDALQ